jgi:hypothetical protein
VGGVSTARIGRCGELLVQYQLLRLGIESAPMTTDAGIDLVAFHSAAGRVTTIQVKTCLAPKPSGGRGKLALDWWIAVDCPADLVAFVDLSTDSVWLFAMADMASVAQQHSNGRHHFYMYVDANATPRGSRSARMADFEYHRLHRMASQVFGAQW